MLSPRMAMLALGLSAVAGAQEPPTSDAVTPVREVRLRPEVWGPEPLFADGEALAAFIDGDGHRCIVDELGVSCLADDGEEAWGVDVDDVDDVVIGDRALAVLGRDGWTVIDVDDGGPVAGLQAGPDDLVVEHGDGRLGAFTGERILWEGGEETVLPGAVAGELGDEEIVDVIPGPDGAVGLLDEGGGVRWMDARGQVGEWSDAGLGRGGWFRTEVTSDGVAVLDDGGLVVLGTDGRILAQSEVRGSDLAVSGDEVWLASRDGVLAIDARTGEIDDEPVLTGDLIAITRQGADLAVVDADGRVRAWNTLEPLGGDQHEAPVRAVAPGPGDTLLSVDEDGTVLRWTADGTPRRLDLPVAEDAGWDAFGRPWVATGDAVAWWVGEERGADVPADRVVGPVEGGLVVGDGERVWRLDRDGAVVWEAEAPHEGRPRVAEGVLLATDGGVLTVLDLDSGVRRRRIPWEERTIRDAGVAVGGLVVVGSAGAGLAGWRPGAEPVEGVPGSGRRQVAIAPDGRWAAWDERGDEDVGLRVRGLKGWPVLAEGEAAGVASRSPLALVATPRHVWRGLEDGRIARWAVGEVTGDTDLPDFSAYAQLDAFTPAPALPEERLRGTLGGAPTAVALHPDGTVAAAAPGLLRLPPTGPAAVVVTDPPLQVTALAWDPVLGMIVGGSDGRVLAVGEAGRITPVRRAPGPVTHLGDAEGALILGGPWGVELREQADVAGARLALPTPDGAPAALGGVAAHGGALDVLVDGALRSATRREDGSWSWTASRRHPGGTSSVLRLPDGSLVTGGEDETVIVWDAQGLQPLYVLEGHQAPVSHLGVDDAGARLVAAGSQGAIVWDLRTLTALGRLAEGVDLAAVALSPDGREVRAVTRTGEVVVAALPDVEPSD